MNEQLKKMQRIKLSMVSDEIQTDIVWGEYESEIDELRCTIKNQELELEGRAVKIGLLNESVLSMSAKFE